MAQNKDENKKRRIICLQSDRKKISKLMKRRKKKKRNKLVSRWKIFIHNSFTGLLKGKERFFTLKVGDKEKKKKFKLVLVRSLNPTTIKGLKKNTI